jgi:hypothetical protein
MRKVLAVVFVCLSLVGPSVASHRRTRASTSTHHSKKSHSEHPTATCVDGTVSYSQHRSGTCSHHGGVKEWK